MRCPLCSGENETVLWRDARCRVIAIDDAGYPGFCRVVWSDHIAELSDLPADDAAHCMRVVLATERALRALMEPHKINLASLGNMVPHLHWHVIPRFRDDATFPHPVWAPPVRAGRPHRAPDNDALAQWLARELGSS